MICKGDVSILFQNIVQLPGVFVFGKSNHFLGLLDQTLKEKNTIYSLQNVHRLQLSLTSRWGRVPGGGGGDWASPPAEDLSGRLQTPIDGGGVPPRCRPDPAQEETRQRSGGLQPWHTGTVQSFKKIITQRYQCQTFVFRRQYICLETEFSTE